MRELRGPGGGARLLTVQGARPSLDGVGRGAARGDRGWRHVGRGGGRREPGDVLGGREHRTRLGVPGILQVMDGMDGTLAREDPEQPDERQDERARPSLSQNGRDRRKKPEHDPDPRGRCSDGPWAFPQL
jgi:hypothetical protein